MAGHWSKMPSFWITIAKMVMFCTLLDVVCYALFFHYGGSAWACGTSSGNLCIVRMQIAVIACVAFTFVIEPAIISAYVSTPEHYEKTSLGFILSFAGFVAYITSGSLIVNEVRAFTVLFSMTPYIATGAMFILTGLVYLAHFAFIIYKRRVS